MMTPTMVLVWYGEPTMVLVWYGEPTMILVWYGELDVLPEGGDEPLSLERLQRLLLLLYLLSPPLTLVEVGKVVAYKIHN